MWSEILLLRKLLETNYKQSPAILDLPQQRASDRGKPTALTFRDKLATATLKLMNDKGSTIDSILTSGQSPSQTLQDQTQQRQQPLSGNSDVVSVQLQQSQQRIAQLESQLGQLQSQYSTEMARLKSSPGSFSPPLSPAQFDPNTLPPPPPMDDGGIPPPPMDAGALPPPPLADSPAPPLAPSSSSIPAAPVLPGFVGQGGAAPSAAAAATAGGPTTVPGTSIPMPPVLTGFTANYPGQGCAPAGAASAAGPSAVAAAPPVDPGPQPTKAPVKPTKKMKALHWKPIITGEKNKQSTAAKNSIWASIDGGYATALREISIADFEDKFTSAPPKAKIPSDDPEAAAKAQREANKPQRLLDPNRHNQLSIMLSKMPALPEMKKALLNLDSTVLKPEQIESLHKNMFTTEDIETVKSSGLPKDRLLAPEQWILEMSTIPQLAARIECWRFSQIFQDEFITVVRPLARLETACQEIRESKLLKHFFTYILVVGNHLNGGTARGRADGFDIESLGKLFRIKDADGTGSLMDYLLNFMMKKFGEDVVANLRAELSTLTESKNSSLRAIAGDAKKLLGKINLTLKMQSLVLAQQIPGDKFEQVLGSFALDAEHKVKALDSRATTSLKAFGDLVRYLEPHLDDGQVDKVQTEEWLPLIDEFVTSLITVRNNQIKKKETAEREAKSAANLAALQAKAGAKKNPGDPSSPQSPQSPPTQELGPNGMPKLRSAADRQNNQQPLSPSADLEGGFPKLRSAADRQQPGGGGGGGGGAPNPMGELQGGFPKLRSAGVGTQQPASSPAPEPTGFVRPQLKKTETKVATTTQVQNVPASEFDNVKRPTAKSNVFLKAQNKLVPMGSQPQPQQQIQQQKIEQLPPPPEHHFGDDDGDDDDGDVDQDFFLSLDLPPPPPDDSD
jgi:hypothetical protein